MERLTASLSTVVAQLREAYSKARFIITVEPVLMIFMLGNIFQYVAIQQLLYLKLCMIEYNDTDLCDNLKNHETEEDNVQGLTSHWLIVLNAGFMVSSIISTLFLGAWSDRVGRRATMILPCLGSLVNGVFLIFSAKDLFMPVWYVVLGSIFLGITGGFWLLISSVFSYMGDISTPENSTMRFGILESMIEIGGFVAVFSVGFVIDNAGYVAAFCFYIACNILCLLYIVLWLPESLPSKKTAPFNNGSSDDDIEERVDDLMDGRTENELGHIENRWIDLCAELFQLENLKGSVKTVFRKRPHFQRLQLMLLIACLTLFAFISTGAGDTTVLYLKKEPLGFTATQISYFSGLLKCLEGATVLIALPLIRMKTSMRDTTIACIGLVGRGAGFILLALANTVVMVFLVPFPKAPTAMASAAVRSMLSKLVAPAEQGCLFSFVAAMESLMTFVSSAIFNAVYPATIHVLDGGFVFIVMAILLCGPFILMFWIQRLQNREITYQIQTQEGNEDSLHGDT